MVEKKKVEFISKTETKSQGQNGMCPVNSTSHPRQPGRRPLPGACWLPLTLHIWIGRPGTGVYRGVGGLISLLLSGIPPPPPHSGSPRGSELGRGGVGAEAPLKFASQQTSPWQEDTAKCGLMASCCSLHY